MAIKVRIPTPLQKLTQDQGEVEIEASNVQSLIEGLEKKTLDMVSKLKMKGDSREATEKPVEQRSGGVEMNQAMVDELLEKIKSDGTLLQNKEDLDVRPQY